MTILPDAMKIVACEGAGGPEVIALKTAELPRPVADEVLIRVHAAGINRLDIFQRKGHYPPPPGASEIMGLEVAGVVVALGNQVSCLKLGDKVCALLTGGGYAEYCVASANLCLPIPNNLSFIEAATLPEALFTVWSNVFMRADIQPGESLLVQGGASGIGTMAIQLARAFGHRVFVTAGSAEKCHACEALGAERAINYKTEDFVEVVQELTGGKGVEVILDMVGGDYLPRELTLLAPDGRICLIAFLGGKSATINLAELLKKRLTLTGSTLRSRDVAFKTKVAEALEQKVWPLLETGKIKPVIYATFPLEQAADAQRLMETDQHIGKIVLTCKTSDS